MRALVVDVGTTSIRTAIVDEVGTVSHVHQRALTVRTPEPGQVELDADEISQLSVELSRATIADGGRCDVVGIANQRATTALVDSQTGRALGPALGWQDLRTVVDCLILQGSGIRVAPNQSATKATWLLANCAPERARARVATVETLVASALSLGALHVTDHSNAAVTGLIDTTALHWDRSVLDTLGIDDSMLARIVGTQDEIGPAVALDGAPLIHAMVGDQSASLFGQSCLHDGETKITFGTGGMLDTVRRAAPEATTTRLASGCFPIVARSHGNDLEWGIEAIMLSAGTCIEWLRDDVGLISSATETESLARSVSSSDGVYFVPALLGLGTPQWDFGARGAFFGLTRGSSRAHLVRAVLEGIAHRGADLVEAAARELGHPIGTVRVDGGMSENSFLMQCLADASGCVVEQSAEREATTRGAGLMALVGAGEITDSDVVALWRPSVVFEPSLSIDERTSQRAGWARAVDRAAGTIPELSSVSF